VTVFAIDLRSGFAAVRPWKRDIFDWRSATCSALHPLQDMQECMHFHPLQDTQRCMHSHPLQDPLQDIQKSISVMHSSHDAGSGQHVPVLVSPV